MIPPSLRRQVLDELHQGHIGVVKMKTLARSHAWCPGIDRDIELLAKSCAGCQAVKPAPPAAPIHPWDGHLDHGKGSTLTLQVHFSIQCF